MMTEEYKEEYKKARKAAMKQYRTCASKGWSLYPPVLDEVSVKTAGEEVLGEMEIPLSLVNGTRTAGRQNAFSKGFLPILPENSEFARKWITLYEAQMEEGIRDPILVYEFMHQFYVQEGNKRVSVMKYLDASRIMAKVIRVIPEKTDDPSVKLYYEFMEFYRSTKIYDIVCKQPGNYAKLLELMGKERNEACSDEERKKLGSLFYHFSSIYHANAAARNEGEVLSAGDAFLIYLGIFSYEEAISKPASKLREEILKMWKEFVPVKEAAPVKRLLEPEDKKPAFWSKLLNSTQKLSIAFVYDKKPDTSSWLYAHELGRLHLEEVFPEKVETRSYIGDVERAVSDGNQVIFTTTPLLMPDSLKAALKYPEVQILNCSLNYAWKSIPTYYARMYEVKFLTGLIAGSMAKGENIGYEADYPIYGSIANINAFAIGVAMVNPNIKIYLNWTSGKEDKKTADTEQLAVVSAKDMISADGYNRRFGLYSNKNGEILNIATSVFDWGIFYEKIIQQMLDGTWKRVSDKETVSRNYWWGLSAGVESLICSSQMPYGTKRLVNTFQNLIIEGSFHPFEGVFYDKNGKEYGKKDTILSNEEIITMDWLFSNIVGEIPAKYELKEQAKPIVELQGVKGEKE